MDIKNEMTVKGKISTVIGADGKSAYELAVLKGFQGTLEEWLGSLKGEKGNKGDKPVKEVDYFTPSDKAEFVKDVEKAALGDIEIAIDIIAELQESYINGEITDGLTKIELSKVYPIGSVYISTSNTSPASLFGGTWERLKDRFLLGAGDTYTAGAMGGAATHTLDKTEIPPHAGHIFSDDAVCFNGNAKGYYLSKNAFEINGTTQRGWNAFKNANLNAEGDEMYPDTKTIGGGLPHNNMPPYLAVYMWKRVA